MRAATPSPTRAASPRRRPPVASHERLRPERRPRSADPRARAPPGRSTRARGRSRAEASERRRRRLIWAMLVPGLAFLVVFFLAPLYQIARFSLGVSHLSANEAIARIRGEQL